MQLRPAAAMSLLENLVKREAEGHDVPPEFQMACKLFMKTPLRFELRMTNRFSDERLRMAFRYAKRPDNIDAATASVESYVALARSCSRALDEPGDSGSSRGEPELGPDPPFSLPLPRVVAWALRLLAPGVAHASDAWLAARRLRRVVRGGVVWLERGGEGTSWLVLHGVAGLFCSQYDALARALGPQVASDRLVACVCVCIFW